MASRYEKRIIFRNKNDLYESVFENRNIKHIRHFNTPKLRYPKPGEIARLQRVTHIWKVGDRYYKLAAKYYGNARYWWVIAWFNQRPTEGHLKQGDRIRIPLPIERILEYYEV